MAESIHSEPMTPEELLEEEIEDLERPMLHSWVPWVIAFASLIALAGVLAIFFFTTPIANIGLRNSSGLPLLTLAEPSGQVDNAPTKFRWQPVRGATSYIVTVTQVDSNSTLIVRPVDEPTLTPTNSEATMFKPGIYTWMVEARGKNNETLAQGETAFVLRGT